jgi:uncharacterized membrane protein
MSYLWHWGPAVLALVSIFISWRTWVINNRTERAILDKWKRENGGYPFPYFPRATGSEPGDPPHQGSGGRK